MADEILPNTGMELPDVGVDEDTWGDILNQDLRLLDRAITLGAEGIVLGASNVTLTADQATKGVIRLSGTLTANVNVIVPASPTRLYLIENGTTGAFSVTVKTPSGTGVPVAQGYKSLLYSNGTNVVQGATSVNGTFTVDATAQAINIRTTAANGTNRQFTLTDGAVSTFLNSRGGGSIAEVGTSSNHLLNILTNNLVRMTVTASGKIVAGGSAFGAVQADRIMEFYDSTAGNDVIRTYDTTGVGAGRGSAIGFGGVSNDTGPIVTVFAAIRGLKTNGTQGDASGYLSLNVNTGSAMEEKAQINSLGYFKASNNSLNYLSMTGAYHESRSNTDNPVHVFSSTSTGASVAGVNTQLPSGSAGRHFESLLNGSYVFQVLANGTVQNSTGLYQSISDRRLKDSIQPLTGSGEFIDALKPSIWQWAAESNRSGHGAGFIADEFQQVCPDAVTGTPNAVGEDGAPEYQSIDASTAEVIANLVAEIQSLRKRVADLENA